LKSAENSHSLSEFGDLLAEAKAKFREFHQIEARLLKNRDLLLAQTWSLGRGAFTTEESVGRGNWYLYLENLSELGTEKRRPANAARFIRFFRENPGRRNSDGPAVNTRTLPADSSRRPKEAIL
jgi:hypothetical protein